MFPTIFCCFIKEKKIKKCIFKLLFWGIPKYGKTPGPLSAAICFDSRSHATNWSTMTSFSNLKNKLQTTWRNMEEQDFIITQPWAIALLIIMAVVSIIILAPTILEHLPETWREVARNPEGIWTRLTAIMDRLAPNWRNNPEEFLRKVRTNGLSSIQSISLITILAVALSLAITYYIWPEYFEQITDSIQ